MTGTPTGRSGGAAPGDGTVDTARSEGAEVGRTAAEAGSRFADTAAAEADSVAGETGRQARDLLDETRQRVQEQAGATQQQAAGGVRDLADELRQLSGNGDGGPVAGLAQEAADRAEKVAGWLDRHEPGDLVEQVRSFARRRPGTFLAGAALAGVLAGRVTRGVVDHERTPDRPDPDRDRAPHPPRPPQPSAPYPDPGVSPDHGVVGREVPATAPPVPAAPTDPWSRSGTRDVPPRGPGNEPPGGPRPVGHDPDGVPAPPPAPHGPAHGPRPGSTTVGEYVDELDRRGDPRVNEDPW